MLWEQGKWEFEKARESDGSNTRLTEAWRPLDGLPHPP